LKPVFPRILMLLGDMNGCSWWRAVRPAEALNKLGYYIAVADKDDPGLENVVHLFDAVILPRMSWENHEVAERFVRALHNAGICVIYEVDDDLFSENVNLRIQQTVERDAPLDLLEKRRIDRLTSLRLCDGMTVSSPRLATVMRNLVDYPVHVVPNAIDLDWWRQEIGSAERTVSGLTVGWSGGSRPDIDLIPMAEGWRRIARRYHHVQFVVMGYLPEVLTGAVPEERLHILPWLPVSEYARPFVNIDIGCAAVADQSFNRSKTPIKAWEYAAAGACVVATPTLYGKDVQHGYSGYQADTADEWEWALSDLIMNRPRRERLARRLAVKVAQDHTLRTNAYRWIDAWTSIIAEFRERQIAHRSSPIILAS
jgi:glycosyltransferase involved in cell wall biosynthesis